MNSLVALDRLTEAQGVELAYRESARKAVARYNTAAGHNPHSAAAEQAWTLRKEALGQWRKARLDLAAAQDHHRRALIMRRAYERR